MQSTGRGGRWSRLAFAAGALAAFAAFGCGEDRRFDTLGGSPVNYDAKFDPCATPDEGCECGKENATAACGVKVDENADYVTCRVGIRVCQNGAWSDCKGTDLVPESVVPHAFAFQALGSPADCDPDYDPCDPYCNVVVDTPTDLEVPDDFEASGDGVTLLDTGAGNCTGLEVTASSDTMTVTSFDPLTVDEGNPVTLTAVGVPDGCASDSFPVTWTVDAVDTALASGDASDNGELTLAAPIAGMVTVTAFGLGSSASVDVEVKVDVVDTVGVSPDAPGTALEDEFDGDASEASTVTWLYPYEDTYFPLGLLPPVVQYKYANSAGSDPAVKMTLRYPAGSSEDDAEFNYALIVEETNAVHQALGKPVAEDPQIVIPDSAWSYFERTARGEDATLVVQRYRGDGNELEAEKPRNIHFVDGQLKGTVYYRSYNSVVGGSTANNVVGAVLKIPAGASEPEVAIPAASGECHGCHTVSADGSTLMLANGSYDDNACPSPYGGSHLQDSCSWDVSGSTPTHIATYGDGYSASPNRLNWGAPYPDGSFYLTNYRDNRWSYRQTSGDPTPYANLRRVSDESAISSTNTPDHAVNPAFAPDGRQVAFNRGRNYSNSLCSSTLGGTCKQAGNTLRVMDFDCGAASGSVTCSGGSYAFSNQRTVADCDSTGCIAAGHPAFVPDGSAVVYQHVMAVGQHYDYDSPMNSIDGARSEIWITRADGSADPVRLNNLNGRDASGANYLPTMPRDVSVPDNYDVNNHSDSGAVTNWVSDLCGDSGSAYVYENELNFGPTASPQEAGGKDWVLFSSRRLYGNIAISSPWQAERSNGSNYYASFRSACTGLDDYGPASGLIETKKLWVSAIDKDWDGTGDPSHPAFYLPGQELEAGNSHAYWVSTPCADEGESCVTNDDCCGGTGDSVTHECRVVDTSSVPPTRECTQINSCATQGAACETTDDCCSGLECPDGGGVCVYQPVPIYEAATFERDYVAECDTGRHPAWRFFEWQAAVPSGTEIQFFAQTRENEADDWAPEPAVGIGDATTDTPVTSPESWDSGSQTVDEALRDDGEVSGKYLKVTMLFLPDSDGLSRPTLNNWRQVYDCVPDE